MRAKSFEEHLKPIRFGNNKIWDSYSSPNIILVIKSWKKSIAQGGVEICIELLVEERECHNP